MNIAKTIIAVGVGTVATALGYVGYRYSLFAKNLLADIQTMVHSLDTSNLTDPAVVINVRVRLKNFTKTAVNISHPTVVLLAGKLDGTQMGHSQVSGKDYTIPARGEVQLDDIHLHISLRSLGSLVGLKDKAEITTKIGTYVNQFFYFPYHKTNVIDLSKITDILPFKI